MCHEQIHCPTAQKGTLMRLMLEQYGDREISLLDGVKVHENNGWTLILPDANHPKVHLYANGTSDKDCEARLQQYRADVEEMINASGK